MLIKYKFPSEMSLIPVSSPHLILSLRARNCSKVFLKGVCFFSPRYNFSNLQCLKLITDLSTENHQASEKIHKLPETDAL